MRINFALVALVAVLTSSVARADLQPWKDYTESSKVWSVTTVKVHPNMRDAYLEGIKKTWVASMGVMKKLGQIEDYHIYSSELPESGDFNMLLVVSFKNDAEMGPNQARYDAFMQAWGAAREKQTTQIAQKDYPGMRTITGEYRMHEITLNK